MNSFLDNFQPFIVHFTDDACIPKDCRGQYMLCVNAMGIKWFEENYIKLEFGNSSFLGGEALGPKYLMLEDSDSNKFDMPRVYIPITRELSNDDSKLGEFLIKALTDESLYGSGIDGFRPSKEYYVNETLYKYLRRTTDHLGNDIDSLIEEDDDIYLPDYLSYDRINDKPLVTDYFLELEDDEKRSRDLSFFFRKNEISKLKFNSYDFDFLPQTFFRLVLQYTKIGDARRIVSPNNVYDAVQKYWANHKSDDATTLLQIIMQTPAKSSSDMSPTLSCNSCLNTSTSNGYSSSIIEKSCYEKYKDAMDEWLSIMLSDINYNLDWMYEEQSDMKFPNFDLIDLLSQLLEEYIEYGKFPKVEEQRNGSCDCPSLDASYSSDGCAKNTILNYIKVLEWSKKCELAKNKNKVKVYGKEFASFLKKF